MKPESVVAIFEYFTGVSFDTMLENVVKASHLEFMSAKKRRHLKRYLRTYYRHAPNTACSGRAASAAKAAVTPPNPFSVFGASSQARR